MKRSKEKIIKAYELAKEVYSDLNIDIDEVIDRIDRIPISIHCWQGDDLNGFENKDQTLTGGIQVTGNYPGKARCVHELRADIEKAFAYIPGKKKLNLHALYLDTDAEVARDEIEPKHFESWVNWAKAMEIGLDFNPSCFSHPKADDCLTLSHQNKDINNFWIRHIKQCRKISNYFGEELGQPSIMNIWLPDGYKDTPIDQLGPRKRLKKALDACRVEKFSEINHIDAVESKLFGIGSESYVVGSHEFYMGYAMKNDIALCLDTGHFHPTEVVSNKLSAMSLYLRHILLHVSRPVRWDSDHVVVLDEELVAIAREIIRHGLEEKVHIGLDFFDGSINRLAAWIIGCRNMRKALLIASLEPKKELFDAEKEHNFTKRLVYLEELKSYPWQAIWDYYCYSKGISIGLDWYSSIIDYESKVLSKRY